MISISIVSHGQGDLVKMVLCDLSRFSEVVEVILTKNIPEVLPFAAKDFPYPVTLIENAVPKGFGANHNAAFRVAQGEWFCVMNPDIRLPHNPFSVMLDEIDAHRAAVIAPAVLSPAEEIEDSVRRFPTPFSVGNKILGGSGGQYAFEVGEKTFAADWVGGMFMLFRSADYGRVGGFDESFFLYYEDVDICTRLWKAGRRVLACPQARVVHDARRASRRKLRYMRWHVASMARYFGKHWLRLPKTGSES